MMVLDNGTHINVDEILTLARQAGAAILKVYNDDPENRSLTFKDDNSPLTLADAVSHEVIAKGLAELTPDIPLLSEEGKDIPYDERKLWEYYWCVDPLDGTKEFVKRNGEFTVNIALIHNRTPILGVIYLPVLNILYFGGIHIGSWKISADGLKKTIIAHAADNNWTAVASRSHASAEEEQVLADHHVTKTIAAGSSLKFCMVAEGSAQIYYRHGPTMEWDTAAGQAIAIYGGAAMTKPNGDPFYYNKSSLLNSGFICKVQ
jgi:3'(2'), 5'-bisphosphate nucleotidase